MFNKHFSVAKQSPNCTRHSIIICSSAQLRQHLEHHYHHRRRRCSALNIISGINIKLLQLLGAWQMKRCQAPLGNVWEMRREGGGVFER